LPRSEKLWMSLMTIHTTQNGGADMAHFITKFQYTTEGKKGLLSNPDNRGDVVSGMFAKLDAKMLNMYVTMGANEVVVITEAQDGAHIKAVAMIAEASGSIAAVETTQAWTPEEFVAICETAGRTSGAYVPPGT
jgi:uncharacterized protein with GYD domain